MVEVNNDELRKIIKSIGSKIFLARKNSRKKIDSISKITKIRSSFLIAIEEARIESLPDKVYLKGFLKTYANFFGINIINELNSLDNYFNTEIEEKKKITNQSTLSEPLPNQKIYIAIFFITIVFLIIYNEYCLLYYIHLHTPRWQCFWINTSMCDCESQGGLFVKLCYSWCLPENV